MAFCLHLLAIHPDAKRDLDTDLDLGHLAPAHRRHLEDHWSSTHKVKVKPRLACLQSRALNVSYVIFRLDGKVIVKATWRKVTIASDPDSQSDSSFLEIRLGRVEQ